MDSMAKTPRDRRATKVGVHSADLPVLPGSSEEKAGRSPKKTWLVDVVDVLLLGLGCPKKDHPTLMLLMFNGYRLKQIREYVMFIVGFTTSP